MLLLLFLPDALLRKLTLFKSYSGAGGSAGASLIDLDITEYVKQAGIGGTIELTAGKPVPAAKRGGFQ